MPLPELYFQHFLIRIQEPSESSRIVFSSRHQPLFPQVDEHFGRVRRVFQVQSAKKKEHLVVESGKEPPLEKSSV